MTLPSANELAIRTVGRRPEWTTLSDTSGAPSATGAGVSLSDAPVTHLDVRLRENLRFRRGRITVDSVFDSRQYGVRIGTKSIFYTSSGSATEGEILDGLTQNINGAGIGVRARVIDADNDNNNDTIIIESNHTPVTVNTVADNENYDVILNDAGTGRRLGSVRYTSGSPADEETIIAELAQALNSSPLPVRAFGDDTDADGEPEVLHIRPEGRGSIDVAVFVSGTGSLSVEATARESDQPFYGVNLGLLSLDADARQLAAVRFFTTARGTRNTPAGWRLEREWTGVGYRGLTELACTAGRDRGYLEVLNTDQGAIRRASIGPAIEE